MSDSTNFSNPFEARLQAALKPVRPSSQYVQSVRRRINFNAPVEVARRISNPPSLLYVLGGVLSVSLLILTAARAIFYLFHRSKF